MVFFGMLYNPSTQHNCLEERLNHEIAAKLLHNDHARQRTRAETSKIFRERRRQQAQLGEGVPMPSAPALLGCDDLAARVEIVLIPEQALEAVPRHLRFISKCKINLA